MVRRRRRSRSTGRITPGAQRLLSARRRYSVVVQMDTMRQRTRAAVSSPYLTTFLEGHGFEVLNSQKGSFGVAAKKHSHEACLEEVPNADYLILVVGGRRGGNFIGSEASITNEEVRLASQGPANDCVVDKINQFKTELTDPTTPAAERILALKFLLHFVGDVHQPLHDADNYNSGGNCEHVQLASGHAATLHAYWDTNTVEAISSNPQQVANTLIAEITPSAQQAWASDPDPADWAQEGFGIATATAYDPALLAGCAGGQSAGPVALNQAYEDAADAAAHIQLEKAGVRLATLLNAALAGSPDLTGDR